MRIRTIKGRIVLAIVLVGCIPLLIGLLLAHVSGMRSLRDVIGSNFQTIAEQAAERLTLLVQSEIQGVRLLASAPLRVRQPVEMANRSYPDDWSAAQRLIHARIQEWEQGRDHGVRLLDGELSRFLLETKVRDGDKMVGLLITDRYGALVAASSEPDHYFLGQEPWWSALQSGGLDRVYVSGLIAGQEGSFRTPEETIDIAVPILDDRQHTVIGAIKASYRFDSMFAMIKQLRIGETGHAMLFDAAGNPLVCPILPRQAHRIPSQLMAMIVSSVPGWAIAEDDGHGATQTVIGHAPVTGLTLPDNSWHVFVRQQPEESYAPIRDQIRNLAGIGLVMVVLLWAMGRYVAARIARPIHVLHTGVEEISQGTYGGPLDIRTGDEFEELAAAVHRMSDRLQASRTELTKLNEDLARRVEEKTAEVTQQMKKLQFAERLATLGKVASGIAHEINNPIAGIKNAFTLVRQAIDPTHPSAEFVGLIDREIARVASIIQNMYQLCRPETRSGEMVDVRILVTDLEALLTPLLQQRRLKFVVDLMSAPRWLCVPRGDLMQVMLNLLTNAIECSPEGSPITLSLREEADGVRLVVRDQGGGIAPEYLPHIFDPFYTTKTGRDQKGMGLGLSVSQSLVQAMGGTIEVDTQVHCGSTFTMCLPRDRVGAKV